MKYWICSSSEFYAPQLSLLRESVEKHTDHKFIHIQAASLANQDLLLTIAIQRLSQALKLLKQDATEVVISGADYLLISRPAELEEEYKDFDCLFCPHTLAMPAEPGSCINLMRGGLINSDFQVWRSTPRVIDFLEKVLVSLQEPLYSIFEYEQAWLPLALATARGGLITHPGYGVAWYNLHERSFTEKNVIHLGTKYALRTMHFSGLDTNPDAVKLSRHGTMLIDQLPVAAAKLVRRYKHEVHKRS